MNSNDIGIADSRNRLREKAQNEATCIALNNMLKDAQKEIERLRASSFEPDWANYQQGRKDGRADAVAEMRSALSAMPVRRMTMSGQRLSYVQLDELNGELDAIYSKTLPEPAP